MSNNSEKPCESPKSSLWELCDDISSSSFADSDCSKSKSGNDSTPAKHLKLLPHESPIKSGFLSVKKSDEISIKIEESIEKYDSSNKICTGTPNNNSPSKADSDIPQKYVSEPNPKEDDWTDIDLELEQLAKDTSLDDITSSDSEDHIEMKLSETKKNEESSEKLSSAVTASDVSLNSEPKEIPVNPDSSSQEEITTENLDTKVAVSISEDISEHASEKESAISEPINNNGSDMKEVHSEKVYKDLVIEKAISFNKEDIVTDIDSEDLSRECVISEASSADNTDGDPEKVSKEPLNSDALSLGGKDEDLLSEESTIQKDLASDSNEKNPVISSNKPETSDEEHMQVHDIFKELPISDIPSEEMTQASACLEKQCKESDKLSEETISLENQNLPSTKISEDLLHIKEAVTSGDKKIQSEDLSKESINNEKSKLIMKETIDEMNSNSESLSEKLLITTKTDVDSDKNGVAERHTKETSVGADDLLTENISNLRNDDVIEEEMSTINDKINIEDTRENENPHEKLENIQDKCDDTKDEAEVTIIAKDDSSRGKFDLLTEHSEENSGDGEVPDNTDTLGLFSVTSKPLDRDEEEESNDEIAEDSAEDNQTEKNDASEAPDFSDIDHSLESFATSMMDHEETSSSNNDAAGNTFGLLISSVSGQSKGREELLENGDMEKEKGEKDDIRKVKNADQTSEQADAEDKESSNGSELVMDLGESNDNYEEMDIEENLVSTTAIFTAEEQDAVDIDSNQSEVSALDTDKLSSISKDKDTSIDESTDANIQAGETEKTEEQIMEIVDLDSNSDDDSSKEPPKKKEKLNESNSEPCSEEPSSEEPSTTTTINLPSSIEIMSTSETAKTSTIICNKGESLIKGIPKPLTPKKAAGLRINTSEITITTIKTPQHEQSDEVVILDSDEEEEKSGSQSSESLLKSALIKPPSTEIAEDVPDYSEIQEISEDQEVKKFRADRCVNSDCTSTAESTEYHRCPLYVLSHYGLKRKGARQTICEHCLDSVIGRTQEVMNCAREGNPLWEMHPQPKEDLVEISDSDDDDENQAQDTEPLDKLSLRNVDLLEKHLEQTLNETWLKYKFDDQIKQSELQLLDQLLKAEKDCEEVTALFNDIQKVTDAMRAELYGEFPVDRHELSPLDITDEAELRLRASLESKMVDSLPVTSTLHKGLTLRKLSDDDDWTPAALGEQLPELGTELDTQGRRSSRQRKNVNYRDMEGVADKEGVTEEDMSKLTLDSFHKNALEVQKHIKSGEILPNVIALPPPEPHPGESQVTTAPPSGTDSTTNNEPSVISDSENCASDNGEDVSDVSLVGDIVVERAPADLPPNGELIRKPLQPGDGVYARKSAAFGGWAPATVMVVSPRGTKQNNGVPSPFTLCRVRFFVTRKNVEMVKQLNARNLAYGHPASVRYPIGARVVALFAHKDNDQKGSYYSGIIAETPTPVNDYRYMVFFDDGYVQYVQHKDIRLVVEHSQRVYEDVLQESRDFVKDYLSTYPERPMVRLQKGQALKVQDSSKKWSSARVLQVDASLAQVMFEEDNHVEWIYRGSTRLAPLYLELKAAGKPQRRRGLGLSKTATVFNTPYVEYTRVDSIKDKSLDKTLGEATNAISEIRVKPRRGRAVAKKSLAAPPAIAAVSDASSPGDSRSEAEASRVVYYSPKIALKPQTMIPHECSETCRRTDVLTMHELRTYNPLARPLLTGFQRNHILVGGKRAIEYRAPCGRRVRNVAEMHRYLRTVGSDMSVDLFHFDPAVHCLAEFVLNWCRVSKKDLSHGMENVPIPCVNFYDSQLPPFCAYSTARIPTVGVHLNLDPDFLCGCDCTDDCADKSKCACWQLTLSGARAIGKNSTNVGYHYKRLPEALPTGIFECNSKCKCRVATCLNRVVQHPLQLKLQVFKTDSRGWGIRALNDVPKGTFLCIYSGNLLTDSTANVDGLLEGDEYLAELDYIEVVERMKEAFEPDVPLRDRILDSKDLVNEDDEDEDEVSEEESQSEQDKDFQPEYIDMRIASNDIGSRLRKRTKKTQYKPAKPKGKEKDKKKPSPVPEVKVEATSASLSDKLLPDPDEEFTITISDDDEAREPSSFAATAGCDDEEYIPRNMSVRELFGRDEKCYIMDAKVRGNIGRYLNHSCAPNVFVQNVFVDTHDPRFPWVGFFAQSFIRAGVELTWNYNYDIGSVPDKIIYCKCGTENCRGRLL